MSRYELRGKVTLVTGASRGIGEAIAKELGRRGARVALLARSEPDLGRVAGAVRRSGSEAATFSVDLTRVAEQGADGEVVRALVRDVEGALGPVDVLVNNAGLGQSGRLEALSERDLRDLFAINAVAPHALCRAFLPSMRERGGGVIVNLSSVLGRHAIPLAGGYCASKFALEGLSESLRAELADEGVHVLVARPGRTASHAQKESVPAMRPEVVARGIADAIEGRAPSVDFTVTGRALMTLGRLSPSLTGRAMRALYRRSRQR
jgi:short-subunit dehydrogenase